MFYIKESEGVKFAKLSGDNNVVHFDKIAGNNSIYGYKIVHGVLVILKFLREIKLTKNYTCIKVQFQKGFEYNCEIRIRKIKKNNSEIIYQLIQNNNISANIKIVLFPKRYLIQNLQKITFKKKYSIS